MSASAAIFLLGSVTQEKVSYLNCFFLNHYCVFYPEWPVVELLQLFTMEISLNLS
jgi:hypothetical protein